MVVAVHCEVCKPSVPRFALGLYIHVLGRFGVLDNNALLNLITVGREL